jgi:pimeloyl-ACP methyl ester carboxylesterase
MRQNQNNVLWGEVHENRSKPTMPVLAIGGEKANGAVLGQQMKMVATRRNEIVLKNTGHWVLEERPKETTDALLKFS